MNFKNKKNKPIFALYADSWENLKSETVESIIHEMNENSSICDLRKIQGSEKNSWRNNIATLKKIIQECNLNDIYVILEFILPNNKWSIDCMLLGKDIDGNSNVIVIEFKQWSMNQIKLIQNYYSNSLFYKGENIEVLDKNGEHLYYDVHPSIQVSRYEKYLRYYYEVFQNTSTKNLNLISCSYCYNYTNILKSKRDVLFNKIFEENNSLNHLYTKDSQVIFKEFLKRNLCSGKGEECRRLLLDSNIIEQKKAYEVLCDILNYPQEERHFLFGEQNLIKNNIYSIISNYKIGERLFIKIDGNPGCGKTYLALYLTAQMFTKLPKCTSIPLNTVIYATKSLQFNIAITSSGKYTHLVSTISTLKGKEFDIAIIDEAQRMREIDYKNILSKAKIVILFYDENQIIESEECGGTKGIEIAKTMNYEITLLENLNTNFRNHSKYISWIENLITYGMPTFPFPKDIYEFRVFNNLNSLKETIASLNVNKRDVARIVTSERWGSKGRSMSLPDGSCTLNFNPSILGELYDKEKMWHTIDGDNNTIGTLYDAMGFEFDYVGVFIGPNLTYDSQHGKIKVEPNSTFGNCTTYHDHPLYETHCKNIYRVLLTRGKKGTFIYCYDQRLSDKFKEWLTN